MVQTSTTTDHLVRGPMSPPSWPSPLEKHSLLWWEPRANKQVTTRCLVEERAAATRVGIHQLVVGQAISGRGATRSAIASSLPAVVAAQTASASAEMAVRQTAEMARRQAFRIPMHKAVVAALRHQVGWAVHLRAIPATPPQAPVELWDWEDRVDLIHQPLVPEEGEAITAAAAADQAATAAQEVGAQVG